VVLGLQGKDPCGADDDVIDVVSAPRQLQVVEHVISVIQPVQKAAHALLTPQPSLQLAAQGRLAPVASLKVGQSDPRQQSQATQNQRGPGIQPAAEGKQQRQTGKTAQRASRPA
jgi:hypothetical protein